MHEFTRQITVPAPAQEVWDLIGRFESIHRWHPDVAEPSLTGDPTAPGTRRVFGAGTAQEMAEELISLDDHSRTMRYRLVDPAFPISDHTATLSVQQLEGGSQITWTASFEATGSDAREVEQAMGDGVFVPGLQGIAAALGS